MDDATAPIQQPQLEPTNPAPPAQPQPQPLQTSEQPLPVAPAPPLSTTEVAPVPQMPEQPINPVTKGPSASQVIANQLDAPAHPQRILLVEDDDGLASVYTTRLNAEGFELKRVPNGEDALAAAIAFHPDLILLDVMMPKVSGFDVLDILRKTPETAHSKIIMLTALSQEADKQKAAALGVDDYLVKSQVVIADVVERIKQVLAK